MAGLNWSTDFIERGRSLIISYIKAGQVSESVISIFGAL